MVVTRHLLHLVIKRKTMKCIFLSKKSFFKLLNLIVNSQETEKNREKYLNYTNWNTISKYKLGKYT